MTFRISFGPRDTATTIVTETAAEAVSLIRSLETDGVEPSIQTLAGELVSMHELKALAGQASASEAGARSTPQTS
ncbi:MAG: hypothetical protein ABW275_08615 [Hansschlegelia sp.]